MPEILKIAQQTKQKFLNMFEFTVKDRTGNVHPFRSKLTSEISTPFLAKS